MEFALCEKRRWRRQLRHDDEMTNFFIRSFSGVGAGALQMTYVYNKSEHHDVAHSLFGNFKMDNGVNNELQKAVLRLHVTAGILTGCVACVVCLEKI